MDDTESAPSAGVAMSTWNAARSTVPRHSGTTAPRESRAVTVTSNSLNAAMALGAVTENLSIEMTETEKFIHVGEPMGSLPFTVTRYDPLARGPMSASKSTQDESFPGSTADTDIGVAGTTTEPSELFLTVHSAPEMS